jgi:hypothetical protein
MNLVVHKDFGIRLGCQKTYLSHKTSQIAQNIKNPIQYG